MEMKDSPVFKFRLEGMNISHEDALERLSDKDINGFIAQYRSPDMRDALAGSMCRELDDETKCREKISHVLDKQDVDVEKVLRKMCR